MRYTNWCQCIYLINIPEPVQYHIYAMAFPFNLRCESVTYNNMWPDLRKASFYVHNSKTHFHNSCTCWQTIQPGIDAESFPRWFCCVLFLRLFRHPWVLGFPSNGCISLGKQTAGCNSPHDWLMSMVKDLTALCNVWRWKWHQWMPFGLV